MNTHTQTHNRLTAFCLGLPGVRWYQKGKINLYFTEDGWMDGVEFNAPLDTV